MQSGFNQGFELPTSGGWKTYFDCDFTELPPASYADGTYQVNGKTMPVSHLSASGSIANVTGTGLVWTLDSGGVNTQYGFFKYTSFKWNSICTPYIISNGRFNSRYSS